jgi:hypothetical protein
MRLGGWPQRCTAPPLTRVLRQLGPHRLQQPLQALLRRRAWRVVEHRNGAQAAQQRSDVRQQLPAAARQRPVSPAALLRAHTSGGALPQQQRAAPFGAAGSGRAGRRAASGTPQHPHLRALQHAQQRVWSHAAVALRRPARAGCAQLLLTALLDTGSELLRGCGPSAAAACLLSVAAAPRGPGVAAAATPVGGGCCWASQGLPAASARARCSAAASRASTPT